MNSSYEKKGRVKMGKIEGGKCKIEGGKHESIERIETKGATGQQVTPKTRPTDSRIKPPSSPELVAAVRAVLLSLGLEPNRGNYRKFDRLIDWRQFTSQISVNTYYGRCFIIDNSYRCLGSAQRVRKDGDFILVFKDVSAGSRDEAAVKLKRWGFELESWV